jgi:hypothetical protein
MSVVLLVHFVLPPDDLVLPGHLMQQFLNLEDSHFAVDIEGVAHLDEHFDSGDGLALDPVELEQADEIPPRVGEEVPEEQAVRA